MRAFSAEVALIEKPMEFAQLDGWLFLPCSGMLSSMGLTFLGAVSGTGGRVGSGNAISDDRSALVALRWKMQNGREKGRAELPNHEQLMRHPFATRSYCES